MKKFEYSLPVDPILAREALNTECSFLKRSQIEDAYFENQNADIVRLRRQDGVARLSCTRRLSIEGLEDHGETIVTDFGACREVLRLMGFEETESMKLTRDAWRKDHYTLHLDRVEKLGSYLNLECQTDGLPELTLKRRALKLIKSLGLNKARMPEVPQPQEMEVGSMASELVPVGA
jgi:predicted adenylyl cyclase CyaB